MTLTAIEEKFTYVQQLCDMLAPCDTGEPIFDKWVAEDFGGKGTSCGFLVHRVRYALGERGPLVNVSLPGCTYKPGENLSTVWNKGRTPFVNYGRSRTLPRGSIVYVNNGAHSTEHVEIIDEIIDNGDGTWRAVVWAAGQPNDKGRECMRKKVRDFSPATGLLGGRKVVGYIPLENIVCTEEPLDILELANEFGVLDRPTRDPYTGKLVG